MKKILKGSLAVMGATALTLIGTHTAVAVEGDPLTITPNPVVSTELFTVSGEGCEVQVRVDFEGVDIVVTTHDDGTWSHDLTAPDAAGNYAVTADCIDETGAAVFAYADASVEVVSPLVAAFGEPTRDACLVTIPVEGPAGSYQFAVWDDNARVHLAAWEKPTDGTDYIEWIITEPAGESAPGVGFELLSSSDLTLDIYDPFNYPAEVADACAEIADGGTDIPTPVTPTEPVTPEPPKKVETAAASGSAPFNTGAAMTAGTLLALSAATLMHLRNIRRSVLEESAR